MNARQEAVLQCLFTLCSLLATVTRGHDEISAAYTGDCTLQLPFPGDIWPRQLILNDSQVVCIREGTFSNVTVSISKLSGSFTPINITIRPAHQFSLVELIGGKESIFSFEDIDSVVVVGITFTQLREASWPCVAISIASDVLIGNANFENCVSGSLKCAECPEFSFIGSNLTCANSSEPLLLLSATRDNGQILTISESTFQQGPMSRAGCVSVAFDCSSCRNNASLIIEKSSFEGCQLSYVSKSVEECAFLAEQLPLLCNETVGATSPFAPETPNVGSAIAIAFANSGIDTVDAGNDVFVSLRNVAIFEPNAADRSSPAVGIAWKSSGQLLDSGNNATVFIEGTAIACSRQTEGGPGVGVLWHAADRIMRSGNNVTLTLYGHSSIRDCRAESFGAGLSVGFKSGASLQNAGNHLNVAMRHRSEIANCSTAGGGRSNSGGGVSMYWMTYENSAESSIVESGNYAIFFMREGATIRDSTAAIAGGGVAIAWYSDNVVNSANDVGIALSGESSILRCAIVNPSGTNFSIGAGVAFYLKSTTKSMLSGNHWGVELSDWSSIHDMTLQTGRGACVAFENSQPNVMESSSNQWAIVLQGDSQIYNCNGSHIDGAGIALKIGSNKMMSSCFSQITILLTERAVISNATTASGKGGAIAVAAQSSQNMENSANAIKIYLFQNSSIVDCRSFAGGAVNVDISSSTEQINTGNDLNIILSNSATVRGCEVTRFGGAFSVSWTSHDYMINSGRYTVILLRHNAYIEHCHSMADGGAVALQWMSAKIQESGDSSEFQISQNAEVRDCQAHIAGGVLYASWEGPFETQDISFVATDSVKFTRNRALQGGTIAVGMAHNSPAVQGVINIVLSNDVILSASSAQLGAFAFVRSLNVKMALQGNVLMKNMKSTEGGTVIFWNVDRAASATILLQNVKITDQHGSLFSLVSNTLGEGNTARLTVTNSTLSNISSGVQGILTARYLNRMDTSFLDTTITEVKITGPDRFSRLGANSRGTIFSTYSCIASSFELRGTVVKDVSVTQMTSIYFFETTLISFITITDSFFYNIVFDDFVEGSWITGSMATSLFLANSVLRFKMINLRSEHSTVRFIKTEVANAYKSYFFVFDSSFDIELIGDFSTVSLIESLPSFRYLGGIASNYSGLVFEEDSDSLIFVPSQWHDLTLSLTTRPAWPRIHEPLEHVTYADDDGQQTNEENDALFNSSCLKASKRLILTCRKEAIREVFQQLTKHDQSAWSCPRGYNLVREFATEVDKSPSYHADCTPVGTGPNSCDLLTFPTKLSCIACLEDTFSAQRGEAKGQIFNEVSCLTCTVGSSCPGKGDLDLQRGYWGSPNLRTLNSTAQISSTENLVVRCPPDYCCLPPQNSTTCRLYKNGEVQDVTESGSCQGFRDGTLCGSCKQNYTFRLFGEDCVLYMDDNNVRLPLMLCILAFLSLLFVLYHTHMRSLSETEDEGTTRSKKKTLRKASLAHITFFFSMADVFYDPMIVGSSSITQEIATVATSITNGFQLKVAKFHYASEAQLLPNSSIFDFLDAPLWQDATGTDKMLIRLFPAVSMMAWLFLVLPISALFRKESKKRKASQSQLDIELPERASPNTPQNASSATPCSHDSSAETPKPKRSRTRSRGDVVFHAVGISFGRGAKALYNIMVFSYGSLLIVAFRLMSCTTVMNWETGSLELRRTFSGDQLCWIEAPLTEALGILTILVLVLFPLSCIILHKRYKQGRNANSLPRRGKWIRRFRELMDYLEAPYKPSCWWYDVFFMVKRVLLVVTHTQLRYVEFLREGIAIFLLLSFIALDCFLRPYASVRDLFVSVILQSLLILLVFLPSGDAFLFSLDISFAVDKSRVSVFALLADVQVGVIFLAILYLLYELSRSLYVPGRSLVRKARIYCQRISAKESRFPAKLQMATGRTLSDLVKV